MILERIKGPEEIKELSQEELLLQAQQTLSGFVDVRSALAAHSNEYIYYRTDHHWTSLGAWYAFEEAKKTWN